MKWIDKFLPDEINRMMFPGILAFVVTGIGVALGFFATFIESRALGVFAYIIAALGAGGGMGFILYGWLRLLIGKGSAERISNESQKEYYNPAYPKSKQPWE